MQRESIRAIVPCSCTLPLTPPGITDYENDPIWLSWRALVDSTLAALADQFSEEDLIELDDKAMFHHEKFDQVCSRVHVQCCCRILCCWRVMCCRVLCSRVLCSSVVSLLHIQCCPLLPGCGVQRVQEAQALAGIKLCSGHQGD